jgi:hypothetical protein
MPEVNAYASFYFRKPFKWGEGEERKRNKTARVGVVELARSGLSEEMGTKFFSLCRSVLRFEETASLTVEAWRAEEERLR